MTGPALLGYGLALYGAAGIVTAVAFVTKGAPQVMARSNAASPPTFTIGARLLILPGTVALWPYVLLRWLKIRNPE